MQQRAFDVAVMGIADDLRHGAVYLLQKLRAVRRFDESAGADAIHQSARIGGRISKCRSDIRGAEVLAQRHDQ